MKLKPLYNISNQFATDFTVSFIYNNSNNYFDYYVML